MAESAVSSLVNLTKEIITDRLSSQDSLCWARVLGEDDGATALAYKPVEAGASSEITSLFNTEWQLNATLSSAIEISDVEFTFVGYPLGSNRAYGFGASGSNWGLVNPSGFDQTRFPFVYAVSSATPPVTTPQDWTSYGPIKFVGGTDLGNQTLIAWLQANAVQVNKSKIILSTYQENNVPVNAVRYSVRLLSDEDTVVAGLLNQSASSLHKGDYVFLYRIGGKLSNSYILSKRGGTTDKSIAAAQQQRLKNTTVVTPSTLIYSCFFQEYLGINGNPFNEMIFRSKLGSLTRQPDTGAFGYYAGIARFQLGEQWVTSNVWWSGGQIFDCAATFGNLQIILNSLEVIEDAYATQYGESAEIVQAIHNLWGDCQSTRGSLRLLMPAPGDELFVIKNSIPDTSVYGECPFQVINVVRQPREGGNT